MAEGEELGSNLLCRGLTWDPWLKPARLCVSKQRLPVNRPRDALGVTHDVIQRKILGSLQAAL